MVINGYIVSIDNFRDNTDLFIEILCRIRFYHIESAVKYNAALEDLKR